MAIDFNAPFGEDIILGPGSDVNILGQRATDFSFIDAQRELIQRVIRRLCTNRGEWLPFKNYGGSLRRWVGETLTPQAVFTIKSDVIAQLAQEPDISRLPSPNVIAQAIDGGLLITIQFYTEALQPVSFSFNPSLPNIFTTSPGTLTTLLGDGSGRISG